MVILYNKLNLAYYFFAMFKLTWLESNIWKHFIILFTSRRNFIPILSIYYLSLQNSQAQEIWFYMTAWYIASLVFQLPAWYIWDKFWNKITIIISKIFLILSSLWFVIWDNFWYFFAWAIFMALWADAFTTWNTSIFLHDTLTSLWKESKFKKISSSMKWWVSFLSIFFIITLPFFTKISLVFPFIIALWIDIIWLLVAFLLFPVKSEHHENEKINIKNLKETLKLSSWTWLFQVIIFSSVIIAFLQVDWSFRTPYLESLGYPVIFLWFVMWLSRFVRFIVWQFAHKIEDKIDFHKLMLIEIFVFSFYYIWAYFITNPYLLWLLFSVVIWYMWWRYDIYTDHIINLIPWKKYKSTILSIKWFLSSIIQILLMIPIAFIMNKSYSLGFLVLWIILFFSLSSVYFWFLRKD